MRAVPMVLWAVVAAACSTEKNPLYCESDGDCHDAARPFCDLDGTEPASDGVGNLCIATPADCPVERCGCTPGAGLSCDLDQLDSCGPDGHSRVTSTCALGCSTSPRCLMFEPSNGLGPALAAAATEPDVVLPAGAHIDTDTGTVTDAGGAAIAVTSRNVPQQGAKPIRAFVARSFVLNDLVIEGANPVAFVATGFISVKGTVEARSKGAQAGPGSQELPAVCAAANTVEMNCAVLPLVIPCWTGVGGGGNAMMGAVGGGYNGPGLAGGSPISAVEPLVGGCRGGSLLDMGGAAVEAGGGGGGAVQLVAGTSVAFTLHGLVDVGGGGGNPSGGGGSGGLIVIESPQVRFDGPGTGIAANGGAGGGCGMSGQDGSVNGTPARAVQCGDTSGGNGGTATVQPDPGWQTCPPGGTCTIGMLGGGGASVGRARIVTKDGTVQEAGAPIEGAVVSRAMLVPR